MILTPITLWKDFGNELFTETVSREERCDDGIKYEYVNFYGRTTGKGRVLIYGVLAVSAENPSKDCLLLLQDSCADIDEKTLAYFVKKGYSILCVDYAGKRDGCERYTIYPEDVSIANIENCKYNKNFVKETAKETCWYEWTAVGAYARQFLSDRFATENIGLIGICDGGEIAWKLAYVAGFSCAITVNACGWRAYRKISKFNGGNPNFDDNDYKFVAGLDSQSYAPYVNCPMMLLCSTGDENFNYERAYDTFSRINPKYAVSSSIAYSFNCGACIDLSGGKDMFMFLDSNVKKRYVFIPKPVDVKIHLDDGQNLLATVKCDRSGIVEKCGAFISEDNVEFSARNWSAAPMANRVDPYECEYALNVYEKSASVFVIGYAVYSSGFTVWSKVAYKKIGGRFRNSRAKSKIIYASNFGPESFSPENCAKNSVGGVFLNDSETLPQVVNMCGLDGVYSKCGLKSRRITCPQFMPDKENILKLDICSEKDTEVTVKFTNKSTQEEYANTVTIIGGVWQSLIIKAKSLKNKNGISLANFTECDSLSVNAAVKFALNNLMWL